MAPADRRVVSRFARPTWGTPASLAGVLLFALVPKCPLCVAAALAAVGVGAGAASAMAPVVRPLLLVGCALTVAAAAGAWLWRVARRAPARAGGCCTPHH
jgi:hypothetical protein